MRYVYFKRGLLLTLVVPFWLAGVFAGETAKKQGAIPWDRFRGPNGAGTSEDKNVPLTFGARENVIWKVELPGAGNSSPIVWGKHVFLHSASTDGKQRNLLCLDTADGKI